MDKRETPRPKKPYSAPKLSIHGTVEKLTETAGRKGNRDGGTPPAPFKTHL